MASTEHVQFKTVFQVEYDDYATRVLERHWPGVRRWRDVRTFPPDADMQRRFPIWMGTRQTIYKPEDWHADLICGGFPCQDISYAGKGAGLDGERSGLWYEFARIIRLLGPRYVVVENVSALLTRGIDAVLGTLASLGYDARWDCIPAAAVGAPHIRDRVFIIAWRDSFGSDSNGKPDFAEREPQHKRAGLDRVFCEDVPKSLVNTDSDGRDQRWECIAETGSNGVIGANWWSTECRLGIHADGLSAGLDGCGGWECGMPRTTGKQANRRDRLRCQGNAVVPQVAQYIGRMIAQHETNPTG